MLSPRKTRSQTQAETKDTANCETEFETMADDIKTNRAATADEVVEQACFTDIPYQILNDINGPKIDNFDELIKGDNGQYYYTTVKIKKQTNAKDKKHMIRVTGAMGGRPAWTTFEYAAKWLQADVLKQRQELVDDKNVPESIKKYLLQSFDNQFRTVHLFNDKTYTYNCGFLQIRDHQVHGHHSVEGALKAYYGTSQITKAQSRGIEDKVYDGWVNDSKAAYEAHKLVTPYGESIVVDKRKKSRGRDAPSVTEKEAAKKLKTDSQTIAAGHTAAGGAQFASATDSDKPELDTTEPATGTTASTTSNNSVPAKATTNTSTNKKEVSNSNTVGDPPGGSVASAISGDAKHKSSLTRNPAFSRLFKVTIRTRKAGDPNHEKMMMHEQWPTSYTEEQFLNDWNKLLALATVEDSDLIGKFLSQTYPTTLKNFFEYLKSNGVKAVPKTYDCVKNAKAQVREDAEKLFTKNFLDSFDKIEYENDAKHWKQFLTYWTVLPADNCP